MKVAVLSDIHSNYHALLACYRDALGHNVDRFLFLGDYVSDLAEPEKTLDLVYEIQEHYPTICLRGNREGYMLDCAEGKASFAPGSKSGSLLFTYEHLRPRDMAFFRSLKTYDIIELDGIQMEIAHAAKDSDRHYFDSTDGNIGEIFDQMQCAYLLTGHSHKQYIRQRSCKTIINPGSVGIPQGGSRWPKYAIVELASGSVSCTLREVPYDFAEVIHSQFASGLVARANHWAIGILYDILTGEEWVLKLLRCVQETGSVYDETVWRDAAVRLGMRFTEREIMALSRAWNI